jgi:hypothetical protein
VLPESVVGATLGRRAIKIASPRVGSKGFAIPLLDGIWRIGQHHVEALEAVALDKLRLGQRVATLNPKILNAVTIKRTTGRGV